MNITLWFHSLAPKQYPKEQKDINMALASLPPTATIAVVVDGSSHQLNGGGDDILDKNKKKEEINKWNTS